MLNYPHQLILILHLAQDNINKLHKQVKVGPLIKNTKNFYKNSEKFVLKSYKKLTNKKVYSQKINGRNLSHILINTT